MVGSREKGVTRFTMELPFLFHKKLKAAASLKGMSLKELILRSLNDYIEQLGEEHGELKEYLNKK
jgi:predicted HicB family RNase H-like nuclease